MTERRLLLGKHYWLNPGMPTPAWTGRTDREETAREEQTRSDSEMIDACDVFGGKICSAAAVVGRHMLVGNTPMSMSLMTPCAVGRAPSHSYAGTSLPGRGAAENPVLGVERGHSGEPEETARRARHVGELQLEVEAAGRAVKGNGLPRRQLRNSARRDDTSG